MFTDESLGHYDTLFEKTQSLKKIADNFYEISTMTDFRQDVKRRKAAFTLAEVLITLGIIGVVAALTLPTLIQHHRKSVVETSLSKFYSVINQAIQRAEVDYGDRMNWEPLTRGYEEDEEGEPDESKPIAMAWFNKYLKPYLNYSKVEIFGTAEGTISVYFNDGSLANFSGAGWSFFPNAKDFKFIVDEDGNKKRDNSLSGNKYFVFYYSPISTSATNKYHYKKGVEPYLYGWDGDVETLKTNAGFGCKKEVPTNGRAYCTALIMMNGWKIPDDYPLKF